MPTPVTFTADGLQAAFGEQVILKDAFLTVHDGERIGLVGANGCGKSTFLKYVAGELQPDGGSVIRRRALSVGYLPQEFALDATLDVQGNVRRGLGELEAMLREFEALPHDSNAAAELEERISRRGAWDLDQKVKRVMHSLNAPDGARRVDTLSGGEKRRVALAAALSAEPELLLLDEPTNHLDISTIEWLEEVIRDYRGACLFVTHDRYFLDRLATRVVELSNGTFYSYDGNYADYLEAKAQREANEDMADSKRRAFLRHELEWVRRMPKARTTKSQSRVDRFNTAAAVAPPKRAGNMELVIPPAPRMSDKGVELVDVSLSRGGKELFAGFSFVFGAKRRIGVLGPNGVGKTSLLKSIIGELQPDVGEVKISSNVIFNYVDQERMKLSDEKSVLEEIGEGEDFVRLGDERISVWGYLRRFQFADDRIRTKIGKLSGGERCRVMLAKILKRGGNFIILDEPTNDLDLNALRLLEEALLDFEGCVLAVSHDRYFLNRICDSVIAFEPGGRLVHSPGGYDYYMAKRAEREAAALASQAAAKAVAEPVRENKSSRKKLSWKEERELEGIEKKVHETEARVAEIETLFASPEFFAQHGGRSSELSQELEKLKGGIDGLYLRWDELETLKNS